jgi:cytoskeletal protein CcmA (bactofilin family)
LFPYTFYPEELNMFGRKGAEGTEAETHDVVVSTEVSSPIARTAETVPANRAQTTTPALTRRGVVDLPSTTRRASAGSSEDRKLIVGKGLSLSGEITSCDVLVVEGKVEAKLSDGKLLEITEAGQFRGSVEIENADIAGRYDGQLVVHGRLTVRSTGRISGMVKYGELEINVGGQIIGEMQVMGGGAQQQSQPSGPMGFKNQPRQASLMEDDRQDKKAERKTA